MVTSAVALCTAGTVLVASAFSIAQLVVGRLILGVGVGLATQATPLYLSEMAPYNLRGGLNILFQLAVTIGKAFDLSSTALRPSMTPLLCWKIMCDDLLCCQ